ncbi:RNA polymerase sigma factor [Nonomuraea sp. NPDC049725]|uniref:RNA polymerase sigma factor n=1 Tax=Nonomuraea sp. NPDC049725 TaxID=3154508 RepID=UPI003422F6EA
MSDDTHRFETVYRATYDQITAYAGRRCDSPQDAADVVAETFVIVWRKIEELPPGRQAKLWVYGVARNVLAGHRRSALRRQVRHRDLDAEMADLYGDLADRSVERNAIAQAFATLPEDDRELVAWEGLDRGEIAVMLGLSRNAVRIRLHRARRRLSRALEVADVRFTPTDAVVPTGDHYEGCR